jgi:IS1 family transposase
MNPPWSGVGSVWTWTAIDADTKLIVSYMLGDRRASTAQGFMRDAAGRIATVDAFPRWWAVLNFFPKTRQKRRLSASGGLT